MTDSRIADFDCQRARQTIHKVLDGEAPDAGPDVWLEGHLAGCAACREFREDLQSIQNTLRSMPALQLPDETLGRVWAATTEGQERSATRAAWLGWRSGAAAAMLAAALFGLWQWTRPAPSSHAGYSDEELRLAAAQTKMVLSLTSQALRKTKRTTRDVLNDNLSDALQRVPIDWPDGDQATKGIGS